MWIGDLEYLDDLEYLEYLCAESSHAVTSFVCHKVGGGSERLRRNTAAHYLLGRIPPSSGCLRDRTVVGDVRGGADRIWADSNMFGHMSGRFTKIWADLMIFRHVLNIFRDT